MPFAQIYPQQSREYADGWILQSTSPLRKLLFLRTFAMRVWSECLSTTL